MTTDEIKAELRKARKAGIKYCKARDRYRNRECRLTSGKTIRYDNNISSHFRDNNPVEEANCALADDGIEFERCKAALAKPYRKAGILIYLVSDERQRQVLNRYYLYCKSWTAIARELNISRQHVYRLHGYALAEISKKT